MARGSPVDQANHALVGDDMGRPEIAVRGDERDRSQEIDCLQHIPRCEDNPLARTQPPLNMRFPDAGDLDLPLDLLPPIALRLLIVSH